MKPDVAFDRLASLAALILKVPLTIVSLVTDKKQFFKAAHGLPPPYDVIREIPVDQSICRYTLLNEPIIAADAKNDDLLKYHPTVIPHFDASNTYGADEKFTLACDGTYENTASAYENWTISDASCAFTSGSLSAGPSGYKFDVDGGKFDDGAECSGATLNALTCVVYGVPLGG